MSEYRKTAEGYHEIEFKAEEAAAWLVGLLLRDGIDNLTSDALEEIMDDLQHRYKSMPTLIATLPDHAPLIERPAKALKLRWPALPELPKDLPEKCCGRCGKSNDQPNAGGYLKCSYHAKHNPQWTSVLPEWGEHCEEFEARP